MSEILDLAQRLGKAIADSPQAAKLRDAKKQMDDNYELNQLLASYRDQNQKIQRLEQDKKPVEVADKHRLAELHDKLVAADLFKKFTAAQVDYLDLMRQVNETLRKHLAAVEK